MFASNSYQPIFAAVSILIALIASFATLLLLLKYRQRLKDVEFDLINTIRRQQGMTLKYVKQEIITFIR